jgi:hypothetical protein
MMKIGILLANGFLGCSGTESEQKQIPPRSTNEQAETNDTSANKANHSSTAANTEDISSDFSLTPSEKEAYEKMKAEQRVRF